MCYIITLGEFFQVSQSLCASPFGYNGREIYCVGRVIPDLFRIYLEFWKENLILSGKFGKQTLKLLKFGTQFFLVSF